MNSPVKKSQMSRILRWSACALLCAAALTSGCAYYNTFYNIKKEFRAAEKQTAKLNVGTGALGQQAGNRDRPGQNMGPIQQYQGIIQSCGKLLEFYPKSRWIDDALMVMGISYYRIQDFPRAERKFTELVTIFPKSKHVEMASIWRARALVAQEKLDQAEEVLIAEEAKFTAAGVKAASYRTRAEISEARNQPAEAVAFLEQIRSISYDRDEKATDFLRLGRSYAALKRNDDARTALSRCLDLTRSPEEAFQARKLLAEVATGENNYVDAKSYLLPMRTDRRFADMIAKVDIELGRVEARIGDPEFAIRALEEFCSKATQGEDKALGYFLQGEVARDRLAEFALAKAKFDSVAGAGASRALQDSARQAAAQVQTGLSALERIPGLTDSLQFLLDNWPVFDEPTQELNEAVDSVGKTEAGVTVDSLLDSAYVSSIIASDSTVGIAVDTTTIAGALGEHDSMHLPTEPTSEIEIDLLEGLSDSLALAPDSMTAERTADSEDALPERELTPAEMIADSIMRDLARKDSLRRAERAAHDSSLAAAKADTVVPTTPDTAHVAKGPSDAEAYAGRVRSMSRKLVSTHLEAASFFDLVARNADSTLAHLEAALAVPDSSDEHWRAHAQLGMILLERETDAERGRMLLAEVGNAEDAPRALRNTARRKIGMEELPPIETEQAASLKRAEHRLVSDSSIDDVISAYRETAAIDSHSVEGCRALHAIAFLQEYKARNYGAARETHEALTRLFPDSSFVAASRAKLAEPDSNSVFLMSDEALETTYQPASELLSVEADSTGWPPDVETLRGRRFR